MNGLTQATEALLEPISKLECIEPYTLVGGTALSIQINTRLSEDLDFMSWRTTKSQLHANLNSES
ncbi:MAG: nucleotidyl transferase AbiEii/AbiGii toxin family protein [Muribaculaceae bacterium]|nr:nucleotidyl transferase AbiEii/AbiGii toxin family protein [Muribaculaceae bacterium]